MKCIQMDNFIPPDVRIKLFSQVEFDENIDDWTLIPKSPGPEEMARGLAHPQNRRPICDFAMKKMKTSTRIKYRVS